MVHRNIFLFYRIENVVKYDGRAYLWGRMMSSEFSQLFGKYDGKQA